jgi:hypothetical protein
MLPTCGCIILKGSQAQITALFLAHPSPALLLPHLPAPAPDAPCLADERWRDFQVLLPLLLLHPSSTILRSLQRCR